MNAIKTFPLAESKFFELCRKELLFSHMVPEIDLQMAVETEMEASYPRSETDGEATRILISYRNSRGNSQMFCVTDTDRMETDSRFDIDDFISKYAEALDNGSMPGDVVSKASSLVLSALSYSITAALDLGSVVESPRVKAQAEWFIKSAISVIFNDPLDVLIAVSDVQASGDEGSSGRVNLMWALKRRTTLT